MEKFQMPHIRPLGDMGKRADRGFSRLESDIYQPDYIRRQEQETDWPGDWGGRTLLAVSLLSLATQRQSVYADEIFETLLSLRNERGYLGHIEEEGVFDEQQFSGHNWLLRGLLSYHRLRGDDRAMAFARSIVNHLYLPATGYYRDYPMSPEGHVYAGEKSGTVTGQVVNHWRTSSDTGCAFMCLDGLADYYLLTGEEAVLTLLQEMVDTFTTIDFVELSMQTHASLSATRGIIKLYQRCGEPAYLAFAERLFALYMEYGATINYANYNWFCRAEWTEPCAIIDSYILCFDLYCATKDTAYLRNASRIRYNAMDFAQRLNGGFGCDICVGPKEVVLHADVDSNSLCEAYWCCTMRGGEGLSTVVWNSYLQEGDTLVLPQYGDSTLDTEDITVRQSSAFPYEGRIELSVERHSEAFSRLAIYIPDYAADVTVTVDGVAVSAPIENGFATLRMTGTALTVCLTFTIPLTEEGCIGSMTMPGLHTYWHGDLLLGLETLKTQQFDAMLVEKTADGYRLAGTDRYLTDLRGNIDVAPDAALLVKSIQVAFK